MGPALDHPWHRHRPGRRRHLDLWRKGHGRTSCVQPGHPVDATAFCCHPAGALRLRQKRRWALSSFRNMSQRSPGSSPRSSWFSISSCSTIRSSADACSGLVPSPDDRLGAVMLVTEHADACRIQHELPAVLGRQRQPAGGEHPQEMGAGEDQHRTVNLADFPDDPVGPRSGIHCCLAPRASVPEQLPAGTLSQDLFRRQALIGAIIPFG